LNVVVIASQEADLHQRAALDRALRLQPARIVRASLAERWATARAVSADATVEWFIFIDDDAVPAPDAFGSLARVFAGAPALIGGRALVAGEQRFGAMFAPPRWGPDAAELNPIGAPESLRQVSDAMRGPMDVPARGLFVAAAALVRSSPEGLDPVALHLALGLEARRTGGAAVCEPRMTFDARPDPAAVLRRMPRLMRDASASWVAGPLHRDPPGPRERLIGRETRIAGNIRGYERRPYPPVSLVVIGTGVAPKALTALRQACGAADSAVVAPTDGAELKRLLRGSGDRYLLVVDAGCRLTRAEYVELVERLELSGRNALALTSDVPTFGPALFHLGRIPKMQLAASDVAGVLAEAAQRLPEHRLFAVGTRGTIVPAPLPALAKPQTLTFILLAASRPGVTRQAFDALSQAIGTRRIIAVIPGGSATTRKVLSAWSETTIVEDDLDANLSLSLNRILAGVETDLAFIVRDDTQVPRIGVERMLAAFSRIPGLGAIVPRVNGGELPEGLSDVQYRDLNDMEGFAERRSQRYARELTLVGVAAAPVLMISQNALAAVGGFDPVFGFTRFGIADFTRRLVLANVPVARSEDAYAHLFPTDASESLIATGDVSPAFAAMFERRWSDRTVFDPARDVVPLDSGTPAAGVQPERTHGMLTVLVPVSDAAEWARLRPAVGALAAALTIEDAVEIAIGLDGGFDLQRAVRELRELLAGAPVPIERTVSVRIAPVPDLAAWTAAASDPVRLRETTRDALTGVRAIDGVRALRALLSVESK
jgi:hypothetical protein